MMDQSEQMEKALSAPAADCAWKLWIQSTVETGKKFFAHTKALHTTEETRGRIRKDGLPFGGGKYQDNSWVRRQPRWILMHKSPGQHFTFEFENWAGDYGLH